MKTDDIQDDIERTRGEMASTLDAIERKLNPRHLMDQAVDTMRELASDQSSVGHVVRENPIPLALIGLGIGWLAISGMSRGRSETESYEGYEGQVGSAWGGPEGLEAARSSDYGYYSAGGRSGYGESGGDGQGVRQKASQMTDRATQKASQMADQAREGISRATDQTRAKVSQWSRQARVQASEAADRTWEAYQEHPITMGLMAFAMGAALGAMIPRSRTEAELIAPRAQGLMRQAKETAGDVVDRVELVAEAAIDKAKEEAREAIRDTTEATKEEARRQGLTGSSGSTLTH